mgnify:CR=1 FL=1
MVQGAKLEKGHIIDTNPATGEVVARVKESTRAEARAHHGGRPERTERQSICKASPSA